MIKIDSVKFNTLTEKQKSYFRIMYAQAGVLFLKGAPGLAKSAIIKTIARKLSMNYIDIRLSMMDETDVGLFPYRNEMEVEITTADGNSKIERISVMAHAVPEWAYIANQAPTIIHFEELNRAPLAVRNAALQILLDRAIGSKFNFNENVFMCASGNLGEKDGTDVEEFDRALNNRLIHMPHDLTIDEWLNDFGNKNVHDTIVSFIKNNPDHFYHSVERNNQNDKSDAYATPRSWTHLSEYIIKNYGKESPTSEWCDDVRFIVSAYVGSGAAVRFMTYLDESMRLSIKDIMNNIESVRDKLSNCTRDKRSELLNSLREYKLAELTEKQRDNLKVFLFSISDDELVSYIMYVIDNQFDYIPENSKRTSKSNDILNEYFNSDIRFEKHLNNVELLMNEAKANGTMNN